MNELNEGCPALSKPEHMARAANRLRQRLRPEDPKDLDFDIMEDCIPQGFFQAEVYVKERRHLIFATDEQLTILAKAKSSIFEEMSLFLSANYPVVLKNTNNGALTWKK